MHERYQRLIRLLSDGRFHSGEDIAKQLGMTRASIWKQIQSLKQHYAIDIDAVRGKGYKLAQPLELLDAETLRHYLGNNMAFEVHMTLESTNTTLMKQRLVLPSGYFCLAEYQSGGRGRRGRTWVSPFGCHLYMSLLWQFNLSVQQLGGLSLAIGVGVAKLLSKYTDQVELKWPNDLRIHNQKLGGILIDIQAGVDEPAILVIGLGLNIFRPKVLTDVIDQPWCTLDDYATIPISRNKLAAELMHNLSDTCKHFERDQFPAFYRDWKKFDKAIGKTVELVSGAKREKGIYRGISNDGALLLEQKGAIKAIYAGEVSLV